MFKTNRPALLVYVLLTLVLAACGGGKTGGQSGGANATPKVTYAPFAPFAGVATVELLTPSSRVGAKPLFEWSPVDGATTYSVFVQFSDGRPYWAWSGTDTSVYLGGLHTVPPENAEGPIIQDGMAWAVLAFDADGNVIASSVLQPISP